MKVLKFEDLKVYQKSIELQQKIYQITKDFPKEERYSLTDQIRRSSRSIGANIAEAWQKRRYVAHFISKLSDSDSEQSETQHWLRTSYLCNYINENQYKILIEKCKYIGSMLGNIINHADKWCI
ncbi:MAG TPA: four helix bundle protein [Victivallales bacterium]|nr:four helix bundle protein [Victivallales bacterium]